MQDDEINNDSDYIEAESTAENTLCAYASKLEQGEKFDEFAFFDMYTTVKNEIAEQAFMSGFKTAISLILSPEKAQQLDELSRIAFEQIKNKEGKK